MTGPAFEPLTDFEADYEIEIVPPHRICRRGSNAFVTPSLHKLMCKNGNGFSENFDKNGHFVSVLPAYDH